MKLPKKIPALAVTVLLLGAAVGHAAGPKPTGGLDLDGLERRLDQIKQKEHSIHRLLDRDKTEVEILRAQVIIRGRAYYRLARGAPRGDLFEYAVRIERLRQALLRDMRRLAALSKEKAEAGRRLSLLEERRAPLLVEQRAAGQARDVLLAKEERDRAFELAFSNSSFSADHTAVYSASSDLGTRAETFASLRGQLPFPVPGRAEVQQVRRDYANGPGLVLRASLSAAARSVYSGRVAYADDYPNYGRTVILDHGGGYFTVTAGLSTIEVKTGDEIPAGARVGAVGTSGGLGEVYFEIRHNDDTLQPTEWFGI